MAVDIAQFRVNNTDYNVADDTKVPYDLLKDTVGFISKNLVKRPYYHGNSRTESGITFTVNADGSIRVQGTPTATVAFTIMHNIHFNNVISTGCPSGSEGTKYKLSYINLRDNSIQYNDFGEGVDIPNDSSDDLYDYRVVIYVAAGNIDKTFYPMLRKADIMDDTYEQYHAPMTSYVQDYTDNALKRTLGNTGKNLITYPYQTGTITREGITFTNNLDGTWTLNGTATATTSQIITGRDNVNEFARNIQSLIGKRVIISDGANNANVYIQFWCQSQGRVGSSNLSQGISEFTIPNIDIANNENWNIAVIALNGAVLNNVKVYPMLREASIENSDYEPYYSGALSEEANNVLGAKNLLLYSQQVDKSTDDGITPTFNSDGTITVNGTATKLAWCVLMNLSTGLGNALKEYAGKSVILNGGIDENLYISLKYRQVNGGTTTMKSSYGNDVELVIPEGIENYNDVQVLYTVASGTVCNNETFKPMLRLASVKDGTYAPPSISNNNITKQLTVEYLASAGWTINKLGLEYGDNFKNKITSNDFRVVRYGKLITVISDSNFSEEITTGTWENGVYVKNLPEPNKILFLPGIFGYISDPSNMIGLQLHKRNGVMQLEFVKSYTIPTGSRVRFNFTYIANI